MGAKFAILRESSFLEKTRHFEGKSSSFESKNRYFEAKNRHFCHFVISTKQKSSLILDILKHNLNLRPPQNSGEPVGQLGHKI